MNAAVQHCFIPKEYLRSYYELRFFCLLLTWVCWPFKVTFAAVCLVFRQGKAYVVWLFPI